MQHVRLPYMDALGIHLSIYVPVSCVCRRSARLMLHAVHVCRHRLDIVGHVDHRSCGHVRLDNSGEDYR